MTFRGYQAIVKVEQSEALTKPPRHSPWGTPDAIEEVAAGIWFFQTPSHGGFWLSPARRATMPTALRQFKTFAGGPWYEEDCDWAIVVCAFPDAQRTHGAWHGNHEPAFSIDERRHAYDALHRWKPDVFRAHYGEYLEVTS